MVLTPSVRCLAGFSDEIDDFPAYSSVKQVRDTDGNLRVQLEFPSYVLSFTFHFLFFKPARLIAQHGLYWFFRELSSFPVSRTYNPEIHSDQLVRLALLCGHSNQMPHKKAGASIKISMALPQKNFFYNRASVTQALPRYVRQE